MFLFGGINTFSNGVMIQEGQFYIAGARFKDCRKIGGDREFQWISTAKESALADEQLCVTNNCQLRDEISNFLVIVTMEITIKQVEVSYLCESGGRLSFSSGLSLRQIVFSALLYYI